MTDETTYINAKPISAWRYANPLTMVCNLWCYRDLVYQFTMRELHVRYKGTNLGVLWAFIQPLILLAVYTFVFSVVFNAKWGLSNEESKVEFALTIFSGMVVYSIFSECVNQAPSLVVSNPNYVKKVVFPLEILTLSALGSSLIHAVFGLLILQGGMLLFVHKLSVTIFYFPLVLLPLLLLSLGLGWFLSSLSVFIRDIGHSVSLVVLILFYMSPIFYPLSRIPEQFRWIVQLNPLANIIEDAHRTLLWGQSPAWTWWGLTTVFSLVVMQIGYIWFMKSKRAFADVV